MHLMAALCTIYLHGHGSVLSFIVRIIKFPINIQLVKNKSDSLLVLHRVFNLIWIGGWPKCHPPLRVFAKYLKNGLADLHETFVTFKTII